jgi:16S rRNA (cytosine1402-N4)-methyltransferase
MLDFSNLHKSVLLDEVLHTLQPQEHKVYLDCTFGAGGYSLAILQHCNCTVIALDRDSSVLPIAEMFKKQFPERFFFQQNCFSQAKQALANLGIDSIDGMVLDIGVSSMQLDRHERGFSFDADSRLDMRMDQSQQISAHDIVNNSCESELADIIYNFGDEPKARLIAKKIQKEKPIHSCLQLANIVRSCYYNRYKTDPATKTFQAIRIAVNQELNELSLALQASLDILKKNARLVAVSFHSLEDKIIKDFFKKQSGADVAFSRYQPVSNKQCEHSFYLQCRQAISPTEQEISQNPRSRSAKMRWGVRI